MKNAISEKMKDDEGSERRKTSKEGDEEEGSKEARDEYEGSKEASDEDEGAKTRALKRSEFKEANKGEEINDDMNEHKEDEGRE